ncbi:MAG: hypothetical protein AAF889_10280, partial [Cyanobacteria bacterium P01_D01_bin.73]
DRRANDWLKQYQPLQAQLVQQLQQGVPPAMIALIPQCMVLSTGQYQVIDAQCINRSIEEL